MHSLRASLKQEGDALCALRASLQIEDLYKQEGEKCSCVPKAKARTGLVLLQRSTSKKVSALLSRALHRR